MLSDVRNWVITGFFLGTMAIFAIVYYRGVTTAALEAVKVRDVEWRGEINARNVKYNNDMMLKDTKVRRREEEIYLQLEEQRKLRAENEKLLVEFSERVPLSDACMHCRIAREHLVVPQSKPAASGSKSPEAGGSKGRIIKGKSKSNLPRSQ